MAEFVKVMRDKERMCDSLGILCRGCRMKHGNNGTTYGCMDFMKAYPEEAEKIIEDWDEKNPIMTNGMMYKKVFGCEPHSKCFADSGKNFRCFGDCKNCHWSNDAEYHAPESVKP